MNDDRRTADAARIERRSRAACAILEGRHDVSYEMAASLLRSSPQAVRRHYAWTTDRIARLH